MIDVLVPVLGRPQNVVPLVESFKRSAKLKEARLNFICSPEDTLQIEACMASGHNTIVVDFPAGRSDYPRKMNHGYRVTTGEWLLMGGDDIRFKNDWIQQFRRAAKTGLCVIASNDLANRQVMKGMFGTHSFVARSYIDKQGASADGPGVLIHEGYDHNFCDRELCHLAAHRKVYAFAPKIEITHFHPLWGTAPNDSTYQKGQANFRKDQKLFLDRAHLWGYAGMSPSEVRAAQGRRQRG